MRAALTLVGGLFFATAGGLAYDALTAAPAHAAEGPAPRWQWCPPYGPGNNRLTGCDSSDTGKAPGFDGTDVRRQIQEMQKRFGGQYERPRQPAPAARPDAPKQHPESRRSGGTRRSSERPDDTGPTQPPIVPPPDRVRGAPSDRRPTPEPEPEPTTPEPTPTPPTGVAPGVPSAPGTGQAPRPGPSTPVSPGGPGALPARVPRTPQPMRPGDWGRYLNTRFMMWLSSSQDPKAPGYVWKKAVEKTLERTWDKNQKSGLNTALDPKWQTVYTYLKASLEVGHSAYNAWLETPGGNRREVEMIAQRVELLRGQLDEARQRGDAAEVARLERLLARAENRLAGAKEIEGKLWPGLEELESGNEQEGQEGQQGQDGNSGQGGAEGQGGQGDAEGQGGQGGQGGTEGQGDQSGQSSPNRFWDVQPIGLPNPLNPPVAPRPEDPRPEDPRPEFPQRDLPRPEVPQRDDPVNPPMQPDSPGGPATPGQPGDPDGPGAPGQPEAPNLPGDPTPPETPRTPESPGLPADPEPDLPGDPAPPETPRTPEGPGLPGDPEQPDAPILPGDPGPPETPEGPADEPGENPEDDPFRVPPLFPAVRPGPSMPGTPTPQEQPPVRTDPRRPSSPNLPGRVLERPRTPTPVGSSRSSGGRSETSRPSDPRPGTGRPSDTRPGGGDPASSRPGNGRGGGDGPVRPGGSPNAPRPAPVTGGPVRTLPAPTGPVNPIAPPQPGPGRSPVPTAPGAGTAPDRDRPPLGLPKPGPAPERDETVPPIKRVQPMPDRPPQQPLQPKVQAPTFTPDKVPSVTGKSPLRGRNIAAEVATLGLEELYGRMLAQNLNWAAKKIAEDPEFARRFADEYDRFQDLNWAERRKRDFGQFLGLNPERFLDSYFIPELRELAESVLNPPPPQQTTPPAPDDGKTRFGVMTPQNWADTRTTDALYRYKAGEEGENLDLLLRDEPRRAPAPAEEPAPAPQSSEREKEKDDDGPSRHEKNMEMIEEGREYRREKDEEDNSSNERPDNHDGGHGLSDGGGDAPAPSAPAPAPSGPPSGGSSNTIDGGHSGGAPGQGGGSAPAPAPANPQGNANSDPARSMNKHDDPSIKA
ncbi:hypothetical protein GCM10010182_51590 [Actinomadura cremea]|nr:hypothetical protein GCM10010182_51590 [Actinomadura cremea]